MLKELLFGYGLGVIGAGTIGLGDYSINQTYFSDNHSSKAIVSQQYNPSVNIVSFGDLMYDRNVEAKLSGSDLFNEYFDSLVMSGSDGSKKMFKDINTDFLGVNLETPVVKTQSDCQKSSKSVKFCSDYKVLPVLKDKGFNVLNLANNHSMDGGKMGHLATIDNLEELELPYIGYIRHGKIYEKNYILTGTKNGIDYAWHGYDFTITKDLTSKYCNILKDYKSKGYHNFLQVHWGDEYETVHDNKQETKAKKLIDCGADLIIGHHPHVIQDIQTYNGKLIIYSLGNFLFDQYFSDETRVGGYVDINYFKDGSFNYSTGTVNAYVGLNP